MKSSLPAGIGPKKVPAFVYHSHFQTQKVTKAPETELRESESAAANERWITFQRPALAKNAGRPPARSGRKGTSNPLVVFVSTNMGLAWVQIPGYPLNIPVQPLKQVLKWVVHRKTPQNGIPWVLTTTATWFQQAFSTTQLNFTRFGFTCCLLALAARLMAAAAAAVSIFSDWRGAVCRGREGGEGLEGSCEMALFF